MHVGGLAVRVQRSQSGSGSGTPPPHAFTTQTSSGNASTPTHASQGSPCLRVPATLLSHVGSAPQNSPPQHSQRSPSTLSDCNQLGYALHSNSSMHAVCACKASQPRPPRGGGVPEERSLQETVEAMRSVYESFGIAEDCGKGRDDETPRVFRSVSEEASAEDSAGAGMHAARRAGSHAYGSAIGATVKGFTSTHSTVPSACTGGSVVRGGMVAVDGSDGLGTELPAGNRSAGDMDTANACTFQPRSRLKNVLQNRKLDVQAGESPPATSTRAPRPMHGAAAAVELEESLPAVHLLNRASMGGVRAGTVAPVLLTDADVSIDQVSDIATPPAADNPPPPPVVCAANDKEEAAFGLLGPNTKKLAATTGDQENVGAQPPIGSPPTIEPPAEGACCSTFRGRIFF